MIDPVVHHVLRAALAFLFLSAAAHKLGDLTQFRAAVSAYDIVPGGVAWILVGLELAAGIGLALGWSAPLPALGAAGILAIYSTAIGVNLARGRHTMDCGCGGPAGRVSLRWGLVGRNAVLIAAALALTLPLARRPLVWLDAFTITAAVLLLALVYASVETVFANRTSSERRAAGLGGEAGLG